MIYESNTRPLLDDVGLTFERAEMQIIRYSMNMSYFNETREELGKLEIDREDVNGRKKWRRNVIKRKSTCIGKWTIKL